MVTTIFSTNKPEDLPTWLTVVGQTFVGGMFFCLIIILAIYGYKASKSIRSSNANILLPLLAKTDSSLGIVVITTVIAILYTTRFIYDVVTAIPSMSSWRVAIQPCTHDSAHIFIFLAWFLWEITPSSLVLFFFWRIPQTHKVRSLLKKKGGNIIPHRLYINGGSHHFTTDGTEQQHPSFLEPFFHSGRMSHLFDDPRRYDSDEESASSLRSSSVPSISSNPNSFATPPMPTYLPSLSPYQVPPTSHTSLLQQQQQPIYNSANPNGGTIGSLT